MSEPDEICDLCNKPVTNGQAAYCGLRHRGITRHWDCHVAKHGEPKTLRQLTDDIESKLGNMKSAIGKLKRRHGL